jgi:hypothetical protein
LTIPCVDDDDGVVVDVDVDVDVDVVDEGDSLTTPSCSGTFPQEKQMVGLGDGPLYPSSNSCIHSIDDGASDNGFFNIGPEEDDAPSVVVAVVVVVVAVVAEVGALLLSEIRVEAGGVVESLGRSVDCAMMLSILVDVVRFPEVPLTVSVHIMTHIHSARQRICWDRGELSFQFRVK